MPRTSFSDFEANFDEYMSLVGDENERLTVEIDHGKAVVLLSEDDYAAMQRAIGNPPRTIESE